ncbi:TonB-dependent siderophore receptor [Methylobacterium sp. EM32]|uniref:TonB-dependent siderophore receptor n=1 Tax=Methylobacterium sp. EM32 TaxID=3163481 RepID=UPI00339EAAE7
MSVATLSALACVGPAPIGAAAAQSLSGGETTVALDEIQVAGQGGLPLNPATGPVNGYVPKVSASGTKTDTPIIETPQTINVVGARQIRDEGASTLAQALAYTSGMTSQAVGGFARTSDGFTIRGFTVETGNSGLLRDGLKLQSGVYDGTQEPYGLERLEVLKGASSILYGQLSPGGVVNAVSKRPLQTSFNEMNVTFGQYNRKEVSGDFTGPLSDDGAWSYRLTGLIRNSDSYLDFTPDDKRYIAPAITWRPSAATSVTLLGYYQEIHTRFQAPLSAVGTLLPNGPLPRFAFNRFYGEPAFDRFDARSGTIGYQIDHAFSDAVRLRHALRYYQSGVDWDYLTPTSLLANRQVATRGLSMRNENATGVASDTSLETKFVVGPTAHTLLTGIDYYRSFLNSERYTNGTVGNLNVYSPVYGTTYPRINYAINTGSKSLLDQVGIYAQDQIKFDRFVLLAGGRQDFARTQILTYRTGGRLDQNDSAFSGRLGLLYLGDYGLAPYVSYSQSFQTFAVTDRNGNPFQPSLGEQYEGGLRWEVPGADTLLSAAFYRIDQTNALVPDPVSPTFSTQTGQIRSQGFEAEARTNFGPLEAIASYSYTDARQTRTTVAANLNQRIDLVPYNQAALFGTFDMGTFGIPGLRLGGGVRYVGSSNISGATFDTHAATLFDLIALYDFGVADPSLKGWRAQINARNVLDHSYVTCVTVNGCRYSEPRNVFGTLSYRW